MRIHSITVFAGNLTTPQFDNLSGYEDVILHIHSSKSSSRTNPEISIFFDNIQKATNFKNSVIQSFEKFLRESNEGD